MKTAKEWISELSESIRDHNPTCACDRCKKGVETFLLESDVLKIQEDALQINKERERLSGIDMTNTFDKTKVSYKYTVNVQFTYEVAGADYCEDTPADALKVEKEIFLKSQGGKAERLLAELVEKITPGSMIIKDYEIKQQVIEKPEDEND